MNTFSMTTSKNITVTPSWITSERYNFTDDIRKPGMFANMIQKLLKR